MMRNSRAAVVLATVLATSLTAGCATVPTNSTPQVLRRLDPPEQSKVVIEPTPDSDPDMLLREFFTASAVPSGNYEGAKSFLTERARQAWDPSQSVIVVDRISVNTLADVGDTQSFNVQGNVVGQLGPGGAFVPSRQAYEATMEVQRVDGQWRISSLPAGVVIERNELRKRYQPHDVYFLVRDGNELVSERRWIYAGQDSLETSLISILLQGPSQRLSNALRFDLPKDVSYTGKENGAYTFTGLSSLGEKERLDFASELVWSLSSAGINTPISINADGDQLVPGVETFSQQDFAENSPVVETEGSTSFYTLADGTLFKVDNEKAEPMDGRVAEQGDISLADVTNSGNYAIVFGEQGSQSLHIGSFDSRDQEIMSAGSFTRPNFESDGVSVWTVADGSRVVRASRSAAGEYTVGDVRVDLPEGVSGEISVLRLSTAGVRVLLIIDGVLYTGVVEKTTTGERRVTNVLEYAPELSGNVIAADWQSDGSILVGTSNPGSPVVRVEQDGSATSGEPIGNITAPVVAVASGMGMKYATDANVVLQIPNDGSDEPNWREVPGLQGVRSVPIVAR